MSERKFFYNPREQAVLEFHEKFNAAVQEQATLDLMQLRIKLIREEFLELQEAFSLAIWKLSKGEKVEDKEWIEILDGMGDLQVVLSGTAVALYPLRNFDEAFNRIHESNMSKLDENGNAIIRGDGKILKSKLFKPPVLDDLL